MHRHQRVRVYFPHGPASRLHEMVHNIHPDPLAAHPAVRLVAQLHHADPDALRLQAAQAVRCVGIQRFRLGFDIHALPGLRRLLFGGIRPEVRIVKIHQQRQAVRGGPSADLHSRLNIVVSAAVAVPVTVKGIIPDPDADQVHAVFAQQCKQILFRAVRIPVADAGSLQGQNRRYIHTQKKVLRKMFRLPDIEV